MVWRRQSVSVAWIAMSCLVFWGCDDEIVTPEAATVSLEIVPTFSQASAAAVAVDRLNIVIASVAGEASRVVKDTTVDINPDGSVDVELTVPFQRDPETYLVTLIAIRSSDAFAAYGGSSTVTISRDQVDQAQTVEVAVSYLGLPPTRVEIGPRDTIVQAGANFTLRATAYGQTGQMTPALFTFSLVNPLDASLLTVDAETGAVSVAGTAGTAQVLVRVMTPDGSEDQSLISIGDFQPLNAWIVNPNTALPAPTQFGTAAYPFSTITQGLNRAAAGDTVFVAIAIYSEPISTTRPVVLLGEITAGNFPIVVSPGPMGSITANGPVSIENIFLQGVTGPLTIQATSVDLDSVELTANQGSVLAITATSTVALSDVFVVGTTGTAAARGIQITNATSASLRRVLVTNTPGPGVRTDNVTTVEVVDSEFSLNGLASDTTFALEIVGSDSVRVDTTNFVNNYGGAAGIFGARAVVADFLDVFANHLNAVEPNGFTNRTAVLLLDVAVARVTNSFFSFNTAAGLFVLYQTVDGAAFVANNLFEGAYWAVRGFAPDTLTGHVEVTGNNFVGSYTGPQLTNVVGLGVMRTAILDNNQVLGAFGRSLSAIADSVLIQNNTLAESDGIDAIDGRGRSVRIDNNIVGCRDVIGGQMVGILLADASGTISNNTVTGCRRGGFVDNTTSARNYTVVVADNTFQTAGLTPPDMGLQVQGSGYTATITGNTIQGGAYDPFGGISVIGNVAPMVSANVTGNILSSGTGRAIGITNVDQLVLDNNSVSGFGVSQTTLGIVAQLDGLNTTARVRGNQFTSNTTQGIYVTGRATDVVLETNNIANNTGPGLWTGTPLSGADGITAQLNTIQGHSTVGVLVTQMIGTFPMNNIVGNAVGLENQNALAVSALNSYWNDVLGPSGCGTCDPQSSGDQVVGNVAFAPFATSPVVGAPGAPAPRVVTGGATPPPPPPIAVLVDATAPGHAALRRLDAVGGVSGTAASPFWRTKAKR